MKKYISCCPAITPFVSLLFLVTVLLQIQTRALGRKSWGKGFQIPKPIGPIPAQQTKQGAKHLLGQVVEVNSCAQKHAHPDEGQEAQGHHQAGDGSVEAVAAVRLHLMQHGHLLHNHKGAEGQQEGVARDVKAMPKASLPVALLLTLVLLSDPLQGGRLVAAARVVFDVGEEGCADIPDGRAHKQGTQPPQDQASLACQVVVGEGNERQEETEGPGPGQFDKIPARRRKWR